MPRIPQLNEDATLTPQDEIVVNNGVTGETEFAKLSTLITLLRAQSGSDLSYSQAFTNTASVTVTHNLNKKPSVTVVDSAGDECEGDVVYIDANSLTVSFSAPFNGTVFCN